MIDVDVNLFDERQVQINICDSFPRNQGECKLRTLELEAIEPMWVKMVEIWVLHDRNSSIICFSRSFSPVFRQIVNIVQNIVFSRGTLHFHWILQQK